MKFLYGSQNFGYDTDDSDKDWLELRYPTWKNILMNEKISFDEKSADGSITKVTDIRSLHDIFYKGNISNTQILFSVQTQNCADFRWFFENRQQLLRLNLWSTYRTTLGLISSECKRKITSKSIVRMKAWYDILEKLPNKANIEFRNPSLRVLRLELNSLDTASLTEIAKDILVSAECLQECFECFYGIVDKELLNSLDNEIIRLLGMRIGR